jgi:hypothetical protein
MAPLSVEGIYRAGRVEFAERSEGIPDGARVRIEFVPGEITDAERREAVDRLMAGFLAGIDFGGGPYPFREEIYEERMRELERRRGL